MSETAPEQKRFTSQEYFDLEYEARERHMYIDGRIYVAQGGTYSHSAIISNVGTAIATALKGKACRHLDSSMRVRYGKGSRFGYTDGLVVCGPRLFDPTESRQLTLLNPTLIIEVLSPGSEKFDRGAKFGFYREIDSFREYVLISQDQPLIETFFRESGGAWRIGAARGIEARVLLSSIEVEVFAADVYADVAFPPEPDIGAQPERPEAR